MTLVNWFEIDPKYKWAAIARINNNNYCVFLDYPYRPIVSINGYQADVVKRPEE
jgi:hypothetical protein